METTITRLALVLVVSIALCHNCSSSQPMANTIIVTKDGTGNFTTITEAILAAPNFSLIRFCIKIRKGIYKENIFIGEEKTNLTLVGDGMHNTIISGNKSSAEDLKTYDTATVGIKSSGFVAQDIAFENTAGPTKNQAVALRSESEHSAFFRCQFKGYQDILYTRTGIQFFRNCEIYGTVDFIFGEANVVFQNCIIYARRPLDLKKNTITAQKTEVQSEESGTIIHNCTIKAAQDLLKEKSKFKTFLGRPWGKFSTTVIMQSFLHDIIDPEGWLEWEGHSVDNVYYAEFDNRGPGAATKGRVKWAMVIDRMEATKFTVRNFIRGNEWIPSIGIPFFS